MAKRYKKPATLQTIQKGRRLRKSDIGTQIINGGQIYDVVELKPVWSDKRDAETVLYHLRGTCRTCGRSFDTYASTSAVYFSRNCFLHKTRGAKLSV